MIFAEKLIQLRKKNGWTQEDLASQLNVSRQAVAKWESSQAIPGLDKILMLSQIFDVSTDYLIKDELEEMPVIEELSGNLCQTISLEKASDFLEVQKQRALLIATGTVLCILSPVLLFMLGGFAESTRRISENTAGGISLIVILILVTVGVVLFLKAARIQEPWKFLLHENFVLEYGVKGMVEKTEKEFSSACFQWNTVGICLCVLCAIPILMELWLKSESLAGFLMTLTLLLVAAGVFLLVRTGIISASFDCLLQKNEYSAQMKKDRLIIKPVGAIYWCLVTALYLGWSFACGKWDVTWMIWPVAACVFAAVKRMICISINRKH